MRIQAGDQKIILDLGDNGIGLTENFDLQSATTLGLNLINLLATHDLQGSIAYESKHGVQFHIEFPVNKPSLPVNP